MTEVLKAITLGTTAPTLFEMTQLIISYANQKYNRREKK